MGLFFGVHVIGRRARVLARTFAAQKTVRHFSTGGERRLVAAFAGVLAPYAFGFAVTKLM